MRNRRSTRSTTERSGPLLGEALRVHPQELLEVLLDQPNAEFLEVIQKAFPEDARLVVAAR